MGYYRSKIPPQETYKPDVRVKLLLSQNHKVSEFFLYRLRLLQEVRKLSMLKKCHRQESSQAYRAGVINCRAHLSLPGDSCGNLSLF
ncbi:hypothetical protein D3C86_1938720 [compost metagenome]